jgi:mono/diheme cytochrome c family protein
LGAPGQFPPLVHSDWVNAATPNRVIRIVLCGLQGPLVLNGQPFSTAAQMTPFRDSKTDQEIADILTFVRSNKDWQNTASDVSPEEVAKIRDAVKPHPNTFTPDELLKVPLEDKK